jgi:RNA polymerase sigma-70 factor (ECF subfamily)
MSIDSTGEPRPELAELLKHIPNLERRARWLTRSEADAHDIVQDTLEKALRAWPRLRAGSNVGAWLGTMLSNTFIDSWRREACRRALCDQIDDLVSQPDDDPPPPAWLDISAADLKRAVARLPPRFRIVFELHVFRRMSYEEISRRLGLPSGTIGSRLLRARQHLHASLTEGTPIPGAAPERTTAAPATLIAPTPAPVPAAAPMRRAARAA